MGTKILVVTSGRSSIKYRLFGYDFYTAHHVRRYGFHGTSHHYAAKRVAMHLRKSLTELNLITLHLGNGASATAIPFYLGRRTGRSSEDLEIARQTVERIQMG